VPKITKRGHKYHAIRSVVDGHKFASKAEAARYGILRLQEKAGIISELKLQPKFLLTLAAVSYRPDFSYIISTGEQVVEDVKGVETERFRMIKKLWRHYGTCMLVVTKRSGSGFVVKEVIPAAGKVVDERREAVHLA
jgi:hypothetical protein